MNCSTKKAFTLIELIVSIVIIGIASASIPFMMSAANKLQEQTVNQDVYFKSVTVMTDILSKYWDSNIAEQDAADMGAMIATIQDADALKTDALLKTRPGFFVRSDFDFRKFYSTPIIYASTIGSTSEQMTNTTAKQSIDEYNGRFIDEVNVDSKVKYDVKVEYVPDVVATPNPNKQTATWSLSGGDSWTAAADSTNLKRITITATRTTGSETMSTSFVYFSSNIGTPGLKVK